MYRTIWLRSHYKHRVVLKAWSKSLADTHDTEMNKYETCKNGNNGGIVSFHKDA
jgi:hypothetical protein